MSDDEGRAVGGGEPARNDDPGITLTADSWTVHARETVSTGEYESNENHITLEGSVNGITELDADTRKELKARLLAVEKTAQEAVARTAQNRLKADGHEDWGVPENGGDA